jgi:hypothetical protein
MKIPTATRKAISRKAVQGGRATLAGLSEPIEISGRQRDQNFIFLPFSSVFDVF